MEYEDTSLMVTITSVRLILVIFLTNAISMLCPTT